MFDLHTRVSKIDENGDPLKRLNEVIDWEMFRPILEKIRKKNRKSNAGRKPFDVVLMSKILILQSLYNLSDDATEAQIVDRFSFMRFLNLA
ncbi:Mobile element protein [Dissulfuribacter thermophilus]|uniref:Mobile element protein n=1 Tax=Dissulfuribacter thermophilus TaxID=1156395 RepID=A0A1B9F410_9BACT|nr:Mobile element protein [Dissulfuribacter thermophilus]